MSADSPYTNCQSILPLGLRPVEWDTERSSSSDGFKLTERQCKRAKQELAEQREHYYRRVGKK